MPFIKDIPLRANKVVPTFNLYSWGSSIYGEIGDNTVTAKSSPVQINANADTVGAGVNAMHYIAGGKLFSVGRNDFGQLGINNQIDRSSPVQVGTAIDWYWVDAGTFSAAGIRNTSGIQGGLYTWGYNFNGQLGVGDQTERSSPIQVGASTDWIYVDVGNQHCLGVRIGLNGAENGTLWTWGLNFLGHLGDGTTTSKSSPIQIGSNTNWVEITAHNDGFIATKTDGTLWAWGGNSSGTLGDGTTVSKSSPVQIGSLTDWKIKQNDFEPPSIASYSSNAVALKTIV